MCVTLSPLHTCQGGPGARGHPGGAIQNRVDDCDSSAVCRVDEYDSQCACHPCVNAESCLCRAGDGSGAAGQAGPHDVGGGAAAAAAPAAGGGPPHLAQRPPRRRPGAPPSAAAHDPGQTACTFVHEPVASWPSLRLTLWLLRKGGPPTSCTAALLSPAMCPTLQQHAHPGCACALLAPSCMSRLQRARASRRLTLRLLQNMPCKGARGGEACERGLWAQPPQRLGMPGAGTGLDHPPSRCWLKAMEQPGRHLDAMEQPGRHLDTMAFRGGLSWTR